MKEYDKKACRYQCHVDFGVISEIQKAKFGLLGTYIFGGKTGGLTQFSD